MPSTLRICLKSGDRIFINGAVIRADRKVTIEILNDVIFLLEHHFMSEEEANTPLRRLYYQAQIMLTEPHNREMARDACHRMLAQLTARYKCAEMGEQLEAVSSLISGDKPFDALKAIRTLYKSDDRGMKPSKSQSPDNDAVTA